jgi:hypothetical protein
MFFWAKHFFSAAEPHKDAAEEVFVVCGVSLMPLLLLPFIEHLRSKFELPGSWDKAIDIVWQAISSGQLYLYSFGLLGTLHWLSQRDRADIFRFPPRKYLSLIVWLPAVLMFIVYSYDPALTKQLSRTLIWTSIYFYALYVILYYILLVFEKLPPPETNTQIAEETNELIAGYKRQRDQK